MISRGPSYDVDVAPHFISDSFILCDQEDFTSVVLTAKNTHGAP